MQDYIFLPSVSSCSTEKSILVFDYIHVLSFRNHPFVSEHFSWEDWFADYLEICRELKKQQFLFLSNFVKIRYKVLAFSFVNYILNLLLHIYLEIEIFSKIFFGWLYNFFFLYKTTQSFLK
jgi:hypothetical protein